MKGYVLHKRLERRGIKVRCTHVLGNHFEAVNGEKRLTWSVYGNNDTVWGPFASSNAPLDVRRGTAMDMVRWLADARKDNEEPPPAAKESEAR